MIDIGATAVRLAVCALLLTAGPAAHGQDPGTRTAATMVHPDGFTVLIPGGWAGGLRADAVWMHRPDRRDARPTTVRLQDGGTDLPRTGRVDGAWVRWDVVALNGGSGGTEYRFVAERPLCDAMLRLEQVGQREFGRPDFGIAWTILASVECRP